MSAPQIPADLADHAARYNLRLRAVNTDFLIPFNRRSYLMHSDLETILTVDETQSPARLRAEVARQLLWLDEHYGTPEKAEGSRRQLAERTADIYAWADDHSAVPLWVMMGAFNRRNGAAHG